MAVLVLAWGTLMPVDGQALGTSYSCGMPWASVTSWATATSSDFDSDLHRSLAEECAERSGVRIFVAGAMAVVLVVAAIVLEVMARRAPDAPAPPGGQVPPRFDGSRWWWWDGSRWRPFD